MFRLARRVARGLVPPAAAIPDSGVAGPVGLAAKCRYRTAG